MSDAVASPPDASSEVWRGVHPLSVFVNFVPRLWGLVRTAWPVLIAVWYGGRSQGGVVDAISLIVLFVVPFLASAVHAITLRYRVAGGRLEIRSGLLNRQARAISLDRIQNVERVQNVFQRLSGLVEVRIETASGAEAEGLLSAVSDEAADALVAALRSSTGPVPAAAAEAEPEVLVRCTPLDLVWYGAADLRLGAMSMLLAVVFEFKPELGGAVAERASALLGVAIVAAALSGGWLVGIAAALVRYWGFVLLRTETGRGPGSLVAVHGLLTRRRTELRRAKVQLVVWSQPLVLRAFGLGAVAIETAAAREEGSGTERSLAVVPCVEPQMVGALVGEALGFAGADAVDPATAVLQAPDPRATVHAVVRGTLRGVGIGAVAGAVLGPIGLLGLLAAPALAGLAWLDVSRQGWALTDAVVVARRGVLTRTTSVLPRSKLQAIAVDQGPILRWLGLGMLTVRVAGSRVQLPALAWDQALALHRALIASGPHADGHPAAGNSRREDESSAPAVRGAG